MNDPSAASDANIATNTNIPSCSKLFTESVWVSLPSFGGMLPSARTDIVDRNRWLPNTELAELLSLGQVLSGSNVVNLSVTLDYRFHGVQGAAAAMVGLVLAPSMLLLLIVMLYDHFSALSVVQDLLKGTTAVTAGLVLSAVVKPTQGQPCTWQALGIGLAVFPTADVLRWPLLPVMLVLIPLALALEWWAMRWTTSLPSSICSDAFLCCRSSLSARLARRCLTYTAF